MTVSEKDAKKTQKTQTQRKVTKTVWIMHFNLYLM